MAFKTQVVVVVLSACITWTPFFVIVADIEWKKKERKILHTHFDEMLNQYLGIEGSAHTLTYQVKSKVSFLAKSGLSKQFTITSEAVYKIVNNL